MSASTIKPNAKEYYRLVTSVDIATVARDELHLTITNETATRLEVDCPHHASQSHTSLHISLDKQNWFCFGCRQGGDVLQLVEFVESGTITQGQSGHMPESHRNARDRLAKIVGLPPLSNYGLSPESIQRAEAARAREIRTFDALTTLAKYYHDRLINLPKVLDWVQLKYGLTTETIVSLQIGFSDNTAQYNNVHKQKVGPLSSFTSAPYDFTYNDFAGTGAFVGTKERRLFPLFNSRITFPYWSQGRIVFMIGRKTPWTPQNKHEHAKYKKLFVHNTTNHEYVAPCIDNSRLYNEDCLLSNPTSIIITEGVTDCIALMQNGFAAISPVTVRFRASDLERIMPRLKKMDTVYICQDNEVSQVGLGAAIDTAGQLEQKDIDIRIAVLPLSDQQIKARETLKNQYGIIPSEHLDKLMRKLKSEKPAEEYHRINQLIAQAKIDVNSYFVAGHTATDFQAILDTSLSPTEFQIHNISTDTTDKKRNLLLEPVFTNIAKQSPIEQERLIKLVQSRFGKSAYSISSLKQQVKAATKAIERQRARRKAQHTHQPKAPPGTCRAAIEQIEIDAKLENRSPDINDLAEAAFNWFANNGARFFYTPQGEPFMFFKDCLYWLEAGERGERRKYFAMIFQQTGIVSTNPLGRHFFEVMASQAILKGEQRETFSWVHSSITKHTIYFNLNNGQNEIAKISPDRIDIIKNGSNEDRVILGGAQKIAPITYIPDVDMDQANALLNELVTSKFACPKTDGALILAWLFCIPLIDFTGTRPMTRFEGAAESGKTTASKIITMLLYGKAAQKKSTDAANYSDGAQNPLMVLDNIETTQMTDELYTFMLTSITGIAKEKRKSGSDTGTITEETKCFINTTGIEPLGGQYTEILTRTFVVRFGREWQSNDAYLEGHVYAKIGENRNMLLSAMMMKIAKVLRMVEEGKQAQVMRLIQKSMGHHGKRRCNEYLALMYLMLIVDEPEEDIEHYVSQLRPEFVLMVNSLNEISEEVARESNPIATALAALFKAYRNAIQSDKECQVLTVNKTNKALFRDKYQIEFHSETEIRDVLARDLFIALNRISREFNLFFPIKSVQQFAQRFANDMGVIRDFGFAVEIEHQRSRVRTYNIEFSQKALEKAEASMKLNLADFDREFSKADRDAAEPNDNVSLPF